MIFHERETALRVVALSGADTAEQPDIATLAKQSGTPDIPGLKIVWLSPWVELAKAHPWKNIIVHQTEGPVGSARGGAGQPHKIPTRPGVAVWAESDGTVYWAASDDLVP